MRFNKADLTFISFGNSRSIKYSGNNCIPDAKSIFLGIVELPEIVHDLFYGFPNWIFKAKSKLV